MDYNIVVFNPCSCQHPVKDVSVLRHGDDPCDTNSDRGIEGRLEQTFTRATHCNIGTATTTPWRVWTLDWTTVWKSVRTFLKSKLIHDTQNCWLKNSRLQTNSKGVNTSEERTRDRQFTHNQTFTTRFHIIPFHCHATRVLVSWSNWIAVCQSRISEVNGGTDDDQCKSTEEMHSFLTEISTMHPELRKTGDCDQADHVLQWLKRCGIEQEEHEFMQDILWETSPEIYVNNTGGQPLECWSWIPRSSQGNMTGWNNWIHKLLNNEMDKMFNNPKVPNQTNQIQTQIMMLERWNPLIVVTQVTRNVTSNQCWTRLTSTSEYLDCH